MSPSETIAAPILGDQANLDGFQAPLQDCRRLELSWSKLHEQLVEDKSRWDAALERIGTTSNGHAPSWAEGVDMYMTLHQQATQMADLASEALDICNQYASALRRAMVGLPAGNQREQGV